MLSTVYAVETSGSVPSCPSRSYTVTRDSVAPVISLVMPTDGLLTNEYALTFTGSLSEQATLTIEGIAVAVASDGTFNYGPVYLAEGANTYATNISGNQYAEWHGLVRRHPRSRWTANVPADPLFDTVFRPGSGPL